MIQSQWDFEWWTALFWLGISPCPKWRSLSLNLRVLLTNECKNEMNEARYWQTDCCSMQSNADVDGWVDGKWYTAERFTCKKWVLQYQGVNMWTEKVTVTGLPAYSNTLEQCKRICRIDFTRLPQGFSSDEVAKCAVAKSLWSPCRKWQAPERAWVASLVRNGWILNWHEWAENDWKIEVFAHSFCTYTYAQSQATDERCHKLPNIINLQQNQTHGRPSALTG